MLNLASVMNSHSRQHGFNNPTGVCCIGPGRMLVAESGRCQLAHCHGPCYELREVLAGNGKQCTGNLEDKHTMDTARLYCPRFAVCGSSQIIYFSDANCIRRLVLSTQEVRTIAGVPAKASTDISTAPLVMFNSPWGLALNEDAGLLYIADSCHHCIKRLAIATGDVTTLVPAGCGLIYPIGLALHRDCEWLYCSDEGGIKRIEVATGTVTSFAGYSCGLQDGPALSAKFNGPRGITLDYEGRLYVADRGNSCIRMVTPEGVVSTLIPGGVISQPYDLDISHKGELVVTDAYQGVLHVFDLNLQRPDHIKVPHSSYTARMVELLESAEAADVTYKVAGEEIHAHKLILATQCDYFKTMLAPNNFQEGQSNIVVVRCRQPLQS
eukprot:GHRR01024631.1.p1 GENE.GHRR01024631.1~~GHRR01024631.1.p1  ORF type:complete len:382 (+),score=78.75 GHRR01024631.1:276-1421(+)